nr:MAG TPA: hypothetical protein [Caudoviricetes sp.]
MAEYERIIPMRDVPFTRIIMDCQKIFTGRDIYVSDKTYLSLLKFLGFNYDLASDTIENRATETIIHRSYRVLDYVAYAIKL